MMEHITVGKTSNIENLIKKYQCKYDDAQRSAEKYRKSRNSTTRGLLAKAWFEKNEDIYENIIKDLQNLQPVIVRDLYEGSESSDECIFSISSADFYDKLEKRQTEILAQGKAVVFVEWNTDLHAGARVVIYADKIPEIMQNYKYRYIKLNDKWIRNSLLGYCDSCGKYTELICISNKGHICGSCSDIEF